MSTPNPLPPGRPLRQAGLERTARFLQLAASGERLDLAARHAGISADRALRMVSDKDQFWATVSALDPAA